jgi:uncharacterized protein
MNIRLDHVVDEPLDWQTTLAFDTTGFSQGDLEAVSEVACRGRLTPMFPDILLQATLSYTQTLRCNRCLESFEIPVTSDVSLVLQVRETKTRTETVELEEDDFGFLQLPEPEIDIRSLVFEQLQLSLPMKPLCRKDCLGLCGGCGTDLNHGECKCKPEIDARWARLQSLK